MFHAFGSTDRGSVRRTNEDAFLCDATLGVLIVADGMGGHAAGEVASRLAVEAIVGFLRRSHDDHEYSWPYGIEPTLSLNGNRLRTAIHLANRRVFRAAENHDEYTGMGTTVVSALISDHRAAIGHVGDSRLYLLRGEQLTQLTRDDSWAATVLGQDGGDTPDVRRHPMRNVLTNVLGARDQTEIHLQECELHDGDRLLLCSDGVHGTLDTPELRAILLSAKNEEAAASDLLSAALARGSRDNLTAVVCAIGGGA